MLHNTLNYTSTLQNVVILHVVTTTYHWWERVKVVIGVSILSCACANETERVKLLGGHWYHRVNYSGPW